MKIKQFISRLVSTLGFTKSKTKETTSSSSQTTSLKFEENLNDNFCIFENVNVDENDFGRFSVALLKSVEEETILGLILIGISPLEDEKATKTNSIYILDVININGADYLITGLRKTEKENIYDLKVTKKQDHEVKVYSPLSLLKSKDLVDKHLEKLIYEFYDGNSDNFKEVFAISQRAFVMGLNMSLTRNLNNYDANNIEADEYGGVSVGFYH